MKNPYKSTLAASYLGYVTQAITVNLAPLFFVIFGKLYDISFSELATLVLFTFIMQLGVDAVMIKLLSVIGERCAAIAAHVFSFFGLVLFAFLPQIIDPYVGILIGVFFYAIGGGITEVVISPIVENLPGDAKSSGMCLLHSFYSWGLVAVVLVTTVLLHFLGDNLWFVVPLVWAAVPLFNTFLFAKVPIVSAAREKSNIGIREYFRSPAMYLGIILMLSAGASEMAMSQWASYFAERGLGVTKVVGDLLGPCLFAVNMGLGRTLYGFFGEKINIKLGISACGCLSLVCFLVTVFVRNPVIALLGCAICGLGVSLLWPGVLSLTSAEFGKRSSPMLFAILALAGDVGCSVGPWLTGAVSDLYMSYSTSLNSANALRAGLLVASVFPFLIVITSVIMGCVSKKQKK